jgi:hypothetical protein
MHLKRLKEDPAHQREEENSPPRCTGIGVDLICPGHVGFEVTKGRKLYVHSLMAHVSDAHSLYSVEAHTFVPQSTTLVFLLLLLVKQPGE